MTLGFKINVRRSQMEKWLINFRQNKYRTMISICIKYKVLFVYVHILEVCHIKKGYKMGCRI